MTKLSKSIRLQENNARKGNISTLYQLFEDYESVMDLEKSKYYFDECKWALGFDCESPVEKPNNRITLDEISLFFFRKFKQCNLKFEDDITILIGNNGSGKTTILDGISKTFSWINARIMVQGRTAKRLETHDVTIGVNDNAEVNATFSLGQNTRYEGSLVRPAKGIETAKRSKLEEYENLSNLYRVINSRSLVNDNQEINIPLFAFYSVERSYIKSNMTFDLEKTSENHFYSRFDALDKTVLDGTSNINDFLKWFIFSDNVSNPDELEQLQKLKSELVALKLVVTESSHPLFGLLVNKEKEFLILEDKINLFDSEKNNLVIESVKKAITSAVPSVSDIFVDRSSGRAEVRLINQGVNINIFQASKGQQIYISLIADIARRLIYLNPILKNRLNGQGIILIDEVELHLHPDWQNSIVNQLRKTFPNIQFIITTHSPIVLSGVKNTKIRILGKNNRGGDIASRPLAQSYARSPSEVLQTVMHYDIAPSFPEKAKLKEYKNIVEQGEFNSDYAKVLKKELEEILGSSHEELIRLDMVKRRREKFE